MSKHQTGHESLGNSPSQSMQLRLEKAKPPFPDLFLIWGRLLLSVTVNQGDKDINILCKLLCDQFIGSTCLYILFKYIFIHIYICIIFKHF